MSFENTGVVERGISSRFLYLIVPSSLSQGKICSAMYLSRILLVCFLLALAQKLLAVCRSPILLHQLLNGLVFSFTMMNTDIGRNMIGLVAIIAVINSVIAIVAYIFFWVSTMTGCKLSDEEHHKNTIELASKLSFYFPLAALSSSFVIGLMPAFLD